MSHRVAMYTVRARKRRDRDNWSLLGDIDGSGEWLGDVFATALQALDRLRSDNRVVVVTEEALSPLPPDHIGYSFYTGRSGVTSVLRLDGQETDRTPKHFEDMRTAVVFRLTRARREGRMALHVPHGRSCKSVIEGALRAAAGDRNLLLELGAIVQQEAFRQAVDQGLVERVTLIKKDPTRGGDKFAYAAQYGSDEVGRLELSIPSRRFKYLRNDPLKRFLDDPSEANKRQILEFGDLVFDEAAVTVELEEGVERTFYLQGREGGHTMTMAINVDSEDRHGATANVLRRELLSALDLCP